MGPMPKEMQLLRAARIEKQKGPIKSRVLCVAQVAKSSKCQSTIRAKSSFVGCTSAQLHEFHCKVAGLTLTSRNKKLHRTAKGVLGATLRLMTLPHSMQSICRLDITFVIQAVVQQLFWLRSDDGIRIRLTPPFLVLIAMGDSASDHPRPDRSQVAHM